jgi:hypothetical protein
MAGSQNFVPGLAGKLDYQQDPTMQSIQRLWSYVKNTPRTAKAKAKPSPARSAALFEALEARQMLSTVLVPGTAVDVTKRNGYETDPAVIVSRVNNNNMFAVSDITTAGIFTQYSTNGGTTWTTKTIATGSTSVDNFPAASGDSVAATDNFGNLYVAYISNAGVFQSTVVLMSTNFGQSFTQIGQFQAYMRPSLTVGGSDTPGAQTLSLSYTGTDGQIYGVSARASGLGIFSGLTIPQVISGSKGGNYASSAVGSDGRVTIAYQKADQIFTATDPDGPGTQGFSTPILATATAVTPNFSLPSQSRGINAAPSLGYDNSGGANNNRLYMAYVDVINPGINDTDIFLRFSDDNGITWTAAAKVNDDATKFSQYMPQLAVDSTTGNIAVAFYDARNSTDNGAVQVFAAVSDTAGASFLPNIQISGPGLIDARKVTNNSDQGGQFGDYISLTFFDNFIQAAWTDNSAIKGGLLPYDVYSNFVTVSHNTAPGIPTLTSISTFTGLVHENSFGSLDFTQFLAASDASDPDNLALAFKITSISAGSTLLINGTAASIGNTFDYGDYISWTPAANTSGLQEGFRVVVSNGTNQSAAPVAANFNVQATIPGDAPVITGVKSTSPVLIIAGQSLALSISGLAPGSTTPTSVKYFYDSNNNNIWDPADLFLGAGTKAIEGFKLAVGTSNLPLGSDRDFFAVGYSAAGSQGAAASLELDVYRGIPITQLYGGSSAYYKDSTGNQIQVRLAGPGYGNVLFDTYATNADPALINVYGTDFFQSSLYIFPNGNRITNVGGIVVGNLALVGNINNYLETISSNPNFLTNNTTLNSIALINATYANINNGPVIVTGGLRQFNANNLTNVEISIGRYTVQPTVTWYLRMAVKTVVDTGLFSLSAINLLSCNGWTDTDPVNNPHTLSAVGINGISVTGDFGPNLSFAPSNAVNQLNSVNITGNLLSGSWDVRGNISSIVVTKNVSPTWSLDLEGVANNSGFLNTFSVRGNASGQITAQRIGSIVVSGNMTNFNVTTYQATTTALPGYKSITNINVTGDIINCDIIATGSIGAVSGRSLQDSLITAGLNVGAPLQPTSAASFISSAVTIGAITLRGGTGIQAFAGTTITAYKITSLSAPTLDIDNAGVPFGLFATSIGSVTIVTPVLRLSNLNAPLVNERPLGGDFILRIVTP